MRRNKNTNKAFQKFVAPFLLIVLPIVAYRLNILPFSGIVRVIGLFLGWTALVAASVSIAAMIYILMFGYTKIDENQRISMLLYSVVGFVYSYYLIGV